MKFGIHCSIRNGLDAAVEEAVALGCETMQIFTRSPRMWKAKRIPDSDAAAFRKLFKEKGLGPLVIHTPYLPNLCSSDKDLYKKSVDAFVEDIERSILLGGEYMIIHPGAYSEESTADEGFKNIIKGLNIAGKHISGKLNILVETMAGGGRRLGNSFEWLARVLGDVACPEKIGFCLDTCHVYGAGFDLSSKDKIAILVKEVKKTISWEKVKVIHLNDSKGELGSHRDRHEHIGKGHIGLNGFKEFINLPVVNKLPGILETPKDAPDADLKNLGVLKKIDKMRKK